MKEVIVIRHAEAEHLVSDARGVSNDTNLTKHGEMEADITGRKISTIIQNDIISLFHAPSRRAAKTAEILSKYLNTIPLMDAALATFHDGIAADMSHTEATAIKQPRTAPRIDWQPFPNAETWRSLHRRVAKFMTTTLPAIQDYLVIVTHGVTHIALVQWWIGLSENALEDVFFYHTVSPCGISRLGINQYNEPNIITLNDVSHLGDRLCTK